MTYINFDKVQPNQAQSEPLSNEQLQEIYQFIQKQKQHQGSGLFGPGFRPGELKNPICLEQTELDFSHDITKIRDAYESANQNSLETDDDYPGYRDVLSDTNQTLGTKIQKVSNEIHQKSLSGDATFEVDLTEDDEDEWYLEDDYEEETDSTIQDVLDDVAKLSDKIRNLAFDNLDDLQVLKYKIKKAEETSRSFHHAKVEVECHEFWVGDAVYKPEGYEFIGVIVSEFNKVNGQARYVVENTEGMLHIMNGNQLAHLSKQAANNLINDLLEKSKAK